MLVAMHSRLAPAVPCFLLAMALAATNAHAQSTDSSPAPTMVIGAPINEAAAPETSRSMPPAGSDLPGPMYGPMIENHGDPEILYGQLPPRAHLRNAPGLVQLTIASRARPAVISTLAQRAAAAVDVRQRPADHTTAVCTTPCMLFVRPGTFTFRSSGPTIRSGIHTIRVPENGDQIVVTAPSQFSRIVGMGLLAGGALTAYVGFSLAVFYASSPFGASPELAVLSTLFALGGLASMPIGFMMMWRNRSPAIEAPPERSNRPRIGFFVLPSPSGAIIAATARF